jgi:hypothetical protein
MRAETGVQFTTISSAGFRLLGALDAAERKLGIELVITSACDGDHSGPLDPHHLGQAYDVRSHDFTDKDLVLLTVLNQFGHPVPAATGGYITAKFFGWLEQVGTPNEHFHFQLRHGVEYP